MAVPTLPRATPSTDPISSAMIAQSIANLRFDRVNSIKIEVRPTVGMVAKDLDRLGLDIRSFREPLTKAVKTVMIPSFRKNFDMGGRPGWEGLAADTIRKRRWSAWPILEVTGKLRKRATQLNIWDIGLTSAIIRKLPADVFYGVFHQAGSSGGAGKDWGEELLKHAPGSAAAERIISKFIPAARLELGPNASETHVHNRAIGILLDAKDTAGNSWHLPARPFIAYQEEDVIKIEGIFLAWMTDRAIKAGRFVGA